MATTQSSILNTLPAHIALLDAQGAILSVNEAWRRFATANVLQASEFGIGRNYLEVCTQVQGECSEEAEDAARGIRQVLRGEANEFILEYPRHSPAEQRWFRLMVWRTRRCARVRRGCCSCWRLEGWILEDYADRLDAEGQRMLRVVSGEARRMGPLIDDLLAFSACFSGCTAGRTL